MDAAMPEFRPKEISDASMTTLRRLMAGLGDYLDSADLLARTLSDRFVRFWHVGVLALEPKNDVGDQ